MTTAELTVHLKRIGDVSDSGTSTDSARGDSQQLMACCGVSTAVHLALVAALAFVWWQLPAPPSGNINAIHSVDPSLDESEPVEFTELPDIVAAPTTESAVPSGGSIAALKQATSFSRDLAPASPAMGQTAAATWQNWMSDDVSAAAELAAPRVGAGDGTGAGIGSDGGDSFFGLEHSGRRIAYVLDCSRSMNHPHNTDAKTRFKRMKIEVVRSVGSLSAENEFFLVFFNDEPIAMPSRGMVPAVPQVQHQYLTWMSALKARGQTEPLTALQIALSTQPDVIYFLTDGSFSFGVERDILALRTARTQIHTFGFDESLTPEQQRAYEFLKDNKGARARQSVESKKDFDHVVAVFKAHQFLQRVATRHNGTFRIIPNNG